VAGPWSQEIMLHPGISTEDFNTRAREATMSRILNFIRNDSGVTAIEYALMASLIAMAIAVSVGLLGQAVASLFSKVVDNWPSLG
jgi:pilus assembly protein Flp/PilA